MREGSGSLTTKGAVSIDHRRLQEFVACAFDRVGLLPEDAAVVSDCFVDAEIRGIATHGVSRLPIYIDALRRDEFEQMGRWPDELDHDQEFIETTTLDFLAKHLGL